MYIVHFAAIDLVSTVIGDQDMHLHLVKQFVECGKLKQARRLVEVVIHLLPVNQYIRFLYHYCFTFSSFI